MSETYNILGEKEMSEKASHSECMKLRDTMNKLTCCQLLTKKELVRFSVVIEGVLKRLESEE